MELKPEEIISNYKIIKQYGNGGMSKVYLAHSILNPYNSHTKNNDLVIVKVISRAENINQKDSDSQWDKAKDEYKLTWTLRDKLNDNIARPIEWQETDDKKTYIIISEFIDGPSLTRLLLEKKALPISRAMNYFNQILNGIKFLHQLDDKKVVIHRDLKSDNIILTSDLRRVKIIDYGIASSFYDGNFISNEGTIYCTANYTTPDVLKLNQKTLELASKGDLKAGKKLKEVITTQFDFHSLGVILYEMITGSLPFTEVESESDKLKIEKWLKYDIPSIRNQMPNVPNSIENIIFKCVASKEQDKKFRYNNIDEIINDVQNWNDENRVEEMLLKPLEKRIFQKVKLFDVASNKSKEKWYRKSWFYILISFLSLSAISLGIIIIVLRILGIT